MSESVSDLVGAVLLLIGNDTVRTTHLMNEGSALAFRVASATLGDDGRGVAHLEPVEVVRTRPGLPRFALHFEVADDQDPITALMVALNEIDPGRLASDAGGWAGGLRD